MTRIVYIAHQMGGDIEGNKKDVLRIMRDISTSKNNVIPIAPYLSAFEYLDDNNPEERELGMKINELYFKKKFMDEVWITGPKISSGVKKEIKDCIKYSIPIECYYESRQLNSELQEIIKDYLKFQIIKS